MSNQSHEFEPIVYRLHEMSGFEFEDAVRRLFDRLGYDAQVAERVADLGRDVVARRSDETVVVECKNTESSIGRPVVQKLHSATVSFEGRARGVIAAPGGFSEPAREHADELGDVVELWNYSELVRVGRSVEIYFSAADKGTAHVFEPERRSPEASADLFERRFAGRLDSRPRPMSEALETGAVGEDCVPALVIEYRLHEVFGTSTYPNLHTASDGGTDVVALDRDLDDRERRYWAGSSFPRRREEPVDGEPADALFGIDPRKLERRLRRRVARANSTVVHYTGRNNQHYDKECRVDAEDVKTRSRQVLLYRRSVEFQTGPVDHEIRFTDDANRSPAVVASSPTPVGEASEIWNGTRGVICNDCGTIQCARERRFSGECEECRRTLCAEHFWTFSEPLPLVRRDLCSACFRRADETEPALRNSRLDGDLFALVATFLSPVGLLLDRRFGAGTVVLAGVVVATAAQWVTGFEGQLGSVPSVAGALIWLAGAVWVVRCILRVRDYRKRRAAMEDYAPAWVPETGGN